MLGVVLPDLRRRLSCVGDAPADLTEGLAGIIDHGHDRWDFAGRVAGGQHDRQECQ
jgi:hypothetical protein